VGGTSAGRFTNTTMKTRINNTQHDSEILPDVRHSVMHATWFGCGLGDTHHKRVSSACLPPPQHQAPPRLSYSGERERERDGEGEGEGGGTAYLCAEKKEAASQSPMGSFCSTQSPMDAGEQR